MQNLPQDSRMVAIRNILTRLCKYSGLSSDRLRNTEIDVEPLLDLVVVRQRALRTGRSPEESMLPVVSDMARRLQPTDRLIADAALSLGLFRESPRTESISIASTPRTSGSGGSIWPRCGSGCTRRCGPRPLPRHRR